MASERHKLAESNIACKKIKIRISSGAVSAWRPECNMLQARVVRTQPYGTHTALHLLKVTSAKCKKNTKRNHHPIMEDLADLICFLFSFLQVCFLARVWLCLRSRLSWFCSPSSAAGGFLLLPSLSPRVAQILCLRQVQGVGLRAEDAASCFAGSASIV